MSVTPIGPSVDRLRDLARAANCEVYSVSSAGDGCTAVGVRCPTPAAKVCLLATLARDDAQRPAVIRLAQRIAGRADAGDEGIARAIQSYVRRAVRFMPEPRELFQPPERTLELGVGDCDDLARATMALSLAAGQQAGMATLGDPTDPTHVTAVVMLGGVWRWQETSLDAELGEHPLHAARRLGMTIDPRLLADLGAPADADLSPDDDPQQAARRRVLATMAFGGCLGGATVAARSLIMRQPLTTGGVLAGAMLGAYTPLAWLAVGSWIERGADA